MLGPGARLLDPEARVFDPGARLLNPGARVLDPEARVFDPGARFLNPGGRLLDPRARVLNPGARVLNPEARVLNPYGEAQTDPEETPRRFHHHAQKKSSGQKIDCNFGRKKPYFPMNPAAYSLEPSTSKYRQSSRERSDRLCQRLLPRAVHPAVGESVKCRRVCSLPERCGPRLESRGRFAGAGGSAKLPPA